MNYGKLNNQKYILMSSLIVWSNFKIFIKSSWTTFSIDSWI